MLPGSTAAASCSSFRFYRPRARLYVRRLQQGELSNISIINHLTLFLIPFFRRYFAISEQVIALTAFFSTKMYVSLVKRKI